MHTIYHILRWSEKYTRTDMVYLARGGFWLFLSQGINFILAFVLLWVFANLLSKEVYGQYRFVLTVLSILSLTTLPGMSIALTRAVSIGALGTITQILKTRIRFGLIGSLGALLGASYYWHQGDATLGTLFLIMSVFIPLMDSATSYQDYLNGLKDFKQIALLHTGQRVLVVSSIIIMILLTENIILIFATYVTTMTIAFWLAYRITLARYPRNDVVDDTAVGYGKHLSLMSGLRTGVQHLDKVALWYLAGPVQVAQLVIASAIPNELSAAVGHVSKLALPKLSNRTKSEMQQSLLRKVLIFFVGMLFVAGAYIYVAPYLFTWFLPQYLDTVFFSQVAALLVLAAPLGLLTQYFYATQHTRALYTMHAVEPIVLLGLYALLIPSLGVIGVIIASLIRFLFLAIALLFFFTRDKID